MARKEKAESSMDSEAGMAERAGVADAEEEKAAPPLPEELRMELAESTAKYKKRQLIASVSLFIIGVAMLLPTLLPATRDSEALTKSDGGVSLLNFLRFGGAFFLFMWALVLFVVPHKATSRRRVLDAASQRPREVAWVYLESVGLLEQENVLALRPHLWLKDGTHAWYQVGEKTAQQVFSFYEDNCPWVSLGYDKKVRRRLRADPDSLARNPVRSREVKKSTISYLWRS